MLIQYYLADGQEIVYETPSNFPTMEDVNNIALLYAQKRTNCLPEYVFVSVRIYHHFIQSAGLYMPPIGYVDLAAAPQVLQIHTVVGPLRIRVMPWATDTKLFLVGNTDDFERYDIDKIFEEVVLKDCERDA